VVGGAVTNLAGEHLVTVTLYTDNMGTQKLWQSTMTTSLDTSGVFSTLLGTPENPLPDAQTMDRPIFLGVSLDGQPEMRPLTTVTASAYALNVADNSITTAKLADRSVTWNKMGTEYVPYIRVNGTKINSGNNSINFTGGDGLKVDYDSNSMSVVIRQDSLMPGIGSGNGARIQAIVDGCGGTNHDGPAGNHNLVGSGCSNVIVTATGGNVIDFSTMGGGQNNTITNQTTVGTNPTWEATPWHFIGGGENNSIVIDVTTEAAQGGLGAEAIVGGVGNTLQAPFSFIGGGQSNHITSQWPTNDDNNAATIEWDGIGAGYSNSIDSFASYSFIGGGAANHISGNFTASIHADYSTIGGGGTNIIYSQYSVIGGGSSNTITSNGNYSVIGGGIGNKAIANTTSVGGGYLNTANSTHYGFANIPGGIQLTANGDAETVIGVHNYYQTGNAFDLWAHGVPTDPARDARVFEIGSQYWGPSGDTALWYPYNAFEVSYNGHSIVYHTNGSSIAPGPPGTPPVYQGATYVESPVYAWGEVDATGVPVGNANFGVSQIVPVGIIGTYMITLCPADPHGGPIPDISQASITVTIVNNDTTDLNGLPPPPSQVSAQVTTPTGISPDSLKSLMSVFYGPNDTNTYMPQTPAATNLSQTAATSMPIANSTTCGFATASQIGVKSGYPRTFFVRTYQSGIEQPCIHTPLAFFFKVCHR
jgi:hypothetical protein